MLPHFFIVLSSVLALVTGKDWWGHVVHSQLVNSHTGCKCCRIITHVTVVPQSLVFSIYVLPHLHLL